MFYSLFMLMLFFIMLSYSAIGAILCTVTCMGLNDSKLELEPEHLYTLQNKLLYPSPPWWWF